MSAFVAVRRPVALRASAPPTPPRRRGWSSRAERGMGARASGRVQDWLRTYPYTALVLGLGLLVRAVLVPLTYG